MANGPEKIFENKVKKFLDELPNIWYFKYWAGPYSKSGIPDIIACVGGHFVAIEVKAEDGHASELQFQNIRKIQRSGGYAYILFPCGFEQFKIDMLVLSKGV